MQAYIYFDKSMLIIFESVAVDPYSHHGFQLTMVGHQRVSAENLKIGV